MVTTRGGTRAAKPGELCTCGRPAVRVILGDDERGEVGYCGLEDGGAPVDGTCVFCGDTIDHDAYARAEAAAGREDRPYASGNGQAQSGPCPLYRLRLADPLPEVHPESVRPFDAAADRLARAPRRIATEINAIVEDARRAAGMPHPEQLDEQLVISHEIAAEQILETLAAHGDRAAVTELISTIVESLWGYENQALDEIADRIHDLTDPAAGVGDRWAQTDPVDRPLLVARLLIRRRLNPEVPVTIHREWWA